MGTVLEDSNIPLSKWVIAIHLLCASKKGMSAHQLHRMLGISYKWAWFMCQRIRYAMMTQPTEKLRGIVEVDETYIGGKISNRLAKQGTGRGTINKIPVVSLIERKGEIRSFPMPKLTLRNLRELMSREISRSATLMTDDLPTYRHLSRRFKDHQTVKRSAKEYVRGPAHVNTLENYFSILKRGITGVYHHVSRKHLHRYLDEFDFRYNTRETGDGERAALAVGQVYGKRLTFKPSRTRAVH